MATLLPYRPHTLPSIPRICRSCRKAWRSFSTTPSSLAGKISQREMQERLKAKKKRAENYYKVEDPKNMDQYSLCDAIRYIKAFEVGKTESAKYEVHVKLKTLKTAPILRPNQIHLPHTVKTDVKFAVICPPDSPAAEAARQAGAVLVGEDEVFVEIRAGRFNFDRLLGHPASMPRVNREGLARILGPKGLMPNPKNGTITNTPAETIQQLSGGSLYRESHGVVSTAIGRMAFTPQQLRENLKAFIDRIKEDSSKFEGVNRKTLHEVVLSSTNSPGFSLNGLFRSKDSPEVEELSVA